MVTSEATESDEATRGHHALLETSQQRRLVAGIEIPTLRTLQSGQDSFQVKKALKLNLDISNWKISGPAWRFPAWSSGPTR